MVLALLGTSCIAIQSLDAQQTPTAVTVDPVVDKQFTPVLARLTIPSHGVEMDACIYLASGANPLRQTTLNAFS